MSSALQTDAVCDRYETCLSQHNHFSNKIKDFKDFKWDIVVFRPSFNKGSLNCHGSDLNSQ